MANELDRKLIPELFQSMLAISLGGCYKGLEMMKTPKDSADKIMDEIKTLVSIPDDAGSGLQDIAKAIAAVWMEKGATWMESCKSAGEKFTEDESEK